MSEAKPLPPEQFAAVVNRLTEAVENCADEERPIQVDPKDLAVAMGALHGFLKSDVYEERDRLVETLDWVRQTVHRSHHTGPLANCGKTTCGAAIAAIARARGEG